MTKKKDTMTLELHRDGEEIFEKDGVVYYRCGIKEPYFDSMLIDLTRMFGKGNEPKTVEEFHAVYPTGEETK